VRIPRLSPPISESHALPCDFEALYHTASRVRSALPHRLAIPRHSAALPRNSEAFYRATVPTFAHIHPSFPSFPFCLSSISWALPFWSTARVYGIVINPGVNGPFEYGYQNQPACCDMSALVTMSTLFIWRAPHRKCVDNDSSSFYFRAPGTSRISRPF